MKVLESPVAQTEMMGSHDFRLDSGESQGLANRIDKIHEKTSQHVTLSPWKWSIFKRKMFFYSHQVSGDTFVFSRGAFLNFESFI